MTTRQLIGRRRQYAVILAFTTPFVVCLSGCTDSHKVPTYQVSGNLTINQKPAEGAIVILQSVGKDVDRRGSKPWGLVDKNGNFQTTTYEHLDGAPVGEYAVTFMWRYDNHSEKSPDRLNGHFMKLENSPMTVSIERKANQLPPIVVNDVKQLREPSRSNEPAFGDENYLKPKM